MTKRIKKNFAKRFGDPPRISITPVSILPGERRYHSEKVIKAYEQLLSSILKRPVTKEELFGLKSLENELGNPRKGHRK